MLFLSVDDKLTGRTLHGLPLVHLTAQAIRNHPNQRDNQQSSVIKWKWRLVEQSFLLHMVKQFLTAEFPGASIIIYILITNMPIFRVLLKRNVCYNKRLVIFSFTMALSHAAVNSTTHTPWKWTWITMYFISGKWLCYLFYIHDFSNFW